MSGLGGACLEAVRDLESGLGAVLLGVYAPRGRAFATLYYGGSVLFFACDDAGDAVVAYTGRVERARLGYTVAVAAPALPRPRDRVEGLVAAAVKAAVAEAAEACPRMAAGYASEAARLEAAVAPRLGRSITLMLAGRGVAGREWAVVDLAVVPVVRWASVDYTGPAAAAARAAAAAGARLGFRVRTARIPLGAGVDPLAAPGVRVWSPGGRVARTQAMTARLHRALGVSVYRTRQAVAAAVGPWAAEAALNMLVPEAGLLSAAGARLEPAGPGDRGMHEAYTALLAVETYKFLETIHYTRGAARGAYATMDACEALTHAAAGTIVAPVNVTGALAVASGR